MPTSPRRPADTPPGPADARPLHPAWLLLLTAAALALRLHALDREALWFDEVNTLWRAAGRSPFTVLARIAGDVQAPLYDLLTWAVTMATARTDAWIARLPSALAGAALVPVAGLIARDAALALRWTARRSSAAGLLAALITTASPFGLRFSQEARPYALLALLSGLALLATLRAVSSGGRRGLVLLAIVAPLLVLTHYYGVLLLAALVLFLFVDARAFGARLPRLVTALLPALAVLLLWSPVAARQFALRDMSSVYRPLDAPLLLEILDAQGPHVALTAAARPVAARLGPLAAIATPAVLAGRVLTLLLLLAGLVAAWRRPPPQTEPAAPEAPARSAVTISCRGPATCLAIAAGIIGAAGLLPRPALAGLAQQLLKEGRPLDPENLAFVQRVSAALPWVAAGLLLLALIVEWLPVWAAVAGAGWYPARVLAFAVILPPLFTALLDATGKHTLAVRNMIVLAPACAALLALGLFSLRRAWRAAALALFAALALLSFRVLPAYSAKADWRAAGAAIAASQAEPLCFPPWLARCVEYHANRPWDSVQRSWSAADIDAIAAQHPQVVFVEALEAEAAAAETSAVQAALDARFGAPRVEKFRGVTCSFYRRP